MKHGSLSPEAIEVTYKRLKEDLFIYDDKIYFPSNLPAYEIKTSEYDTLIGGVEI